MGTLSPDPLAKVVAQLQAQEGELQAELKALETGFEEKTAKLREQLERIQTALGDLTGKALHRERGRPKAKGRKRGAGRKTGYTTAEVAELAAEILKQTSPQSFEDLLGQIRERAQQAGRSLVGLHLRLRQAVGDETRFAKGDRGYELA